MKKSWRSSIVVSNNSYSHNRTSTAIPIQNLITYSLLLLISFHNPSSHISNDESFGCVPGDIPENVKTTIVEFVRLILGWHSRPKQYNIHLRLRLRTLVNERVMKEDDQENVTENVAEENIKVNYQKIYLSVVSVAKAWSRLSNPSIIISKVYQPISRPFLWLLRLSFIQPEPRSRLKRVSRGINILSVRVAYNLIFNLSSKKLLSISSQKIVLFNALHTENILNDNILKKREPFIANVQITKYTGSWLMLVLLQSGDIELNPGPISITFVTQNCRGLKKE